MTFKELVKLLDRYSEPHQRINLDEYGAFVNISYAIRSHDILNVALLLRTHEGKIDLNAERGHAGIMPSMYSLVSLACAEKDAGILELLLMHGADINNVLSDGSTALHTASAVGDNEEVIRCCIEHGANVNATDWGGYAPIHVATVKNLATNVKCLIDCGADVYQRTYSGDDPVDLATQYDADSVLDLFRNFGILAKYDIGRLMDMAEFNESFRAKVIFENMLFET